MDDEVGPEHRARPGPEGDAVVERAIVGPEGPVEHRPAQEEHQAQLPGHGTESADQPARPSSLRPENSAMTRRPRPPSGGAARPRCWWCAWHRWSATKGTGASLRMRPCQPPSSAPQSLACPRLSRARASRPRPGRWPGTGRSGHGDEVGVQVGVEEGKEGKLGDDRLVGSGGDGAAGVPVPLVEADGQRRGRQRAPRRSRR